MRQKEKIGTVYALLSAALYGLYPVAVSQGAQSIPPLTFATFSMLFASLIFFLQLTILGRLRECKNAGAYFPICMNTLLSVLIPNVLFFIGAGMTSDLNTSILLLSEMLFLLIFTPFLGEKNSREKVLGSVLILVGAVAILYNGFSHPNLGDLLVFLSTLTFCFGSFYSKKALRMVSPSTILAIRYLLAGLAFIPITLIFEPNDYGQIFWEFWPLIMFTGVVLIGLAKLFWLSSFVYLDISKASSLGLAAPFFSLIAISFINQTLPTTLQWLGIFIIALGVYVSAKRHSVIQENPA